MSGSSRVKKDSTMGEQAAGDGEVWSDGEVERATNLPLAPDLQQEHLEQELAT